MTGNEVIIWAYNKGYRVDEHGNLLSPNGNKRKLRKDTRGYYDTNVRINGKLYHLQLHRLCAYQKFGDKLFDAECVRHLDGNPLNNSYNNIEIGTQSENMMDVPKEIRINRSIKASHSYIMKWDENDVVNIKKFYNETKSYKKTMSEFGMKSTGTLFFILHKR